MSLLARLDDFLVNHLPLELQEVVVDNYLDINEASRIPLTSSSKKMRVRYRHHRSTNLCVQASAPLLSCGGSSHKSIVVKSTEIERFAQDVTRFETVFSSSPITFSEVENIAFVLPFEDEGLVSLVQHMLGSLGPSIRTVKFKSWEDQMDLADFFGDIGQLAPCFPGIRVLTLVFDHLDLQEQREDEDEDSNVNDDSEDDNVQGSQDDGGDDPNGDDGEGSEGDGGEGLEGDDDEDSETELPPWQTWHQPQFFDCFAHFPHLACFKLRTALEVFPVVKSKDIREARDQEDAWVARLAGMLPSLGRIHVGHSYSEVLCHYGFWYSGERVVRYRDSSTGLWFRGTWSFPGGRMHSMQRRTMSDPKTTEKIYFDAWESDEEHGSQFCFSRVHHRPNQPVSSQSHHVCIDPSCDIHSYPELAPESWMSPVYNGSHAYSSLVQDRAVRWTVGAFAGDDQCFVVTRFPQPLKFASSPWILAVSLWRPGVAFPPDIQVLSQPATDTQPSPISIPPTPFFLSPIVPAVGECSHPQ
ncbi:hypothetical protein NMY22_g15222 [Coprinellus aureogranulatus]|nr:hypothetical protein NMY22_g15222 [Coprinellus aureogranulatus]